MIAFTLVDLAAAEEFFRRVGLLEKDNEAARTQILLDMYEEGLVINIVESKKSKEEFVEEKKKHFGVLDLTKEAFPNKEDEDEEFGN